MRCAFTPFPAPDGSSPAGRHQNRNLPRTFGRMGQSSSRNIPSKIRLPHSFRGQTLHPRRLDRCGHAPHRCRQYTRRSRTRPFIRPPAGTLSAGFPALAGVRQTLHHVSTNSRKRRSSRPKCGARTAIGQTITRSPSPPHCCCRRSRSTDHHHRVAHGGARARYCRGNPLRDRGG